MRGTNNLYADIGYVSLNHTGEQLCGDHVEIAGQDEAGSVIVLADGLGSGVKASILSTLTSTILSTMLASGLKLEDCVETIAATLPVCATRSIAYSTFTILRLVNNERAEIIQYDNPRVVLLRDGKHMEFPCTELVVGGKKILRSDVKLPAGRYLFIDERRRGARGRRRGV
jgi:predicted aconitase with swiveling domain